MVATDELVKKVTRTRKKVTAPSVGVPEPAVTEEKTLVDVSNYLTELTEKIGQVKTEIAELLKTIRDTRGMWEKEKVEHGREVLERSTQEELVRKREKEEYEYQVMMERKRAEDEFTEKREKWGKELLERKEEIEADKIELTELRSKAANFENEMGKAVKEAEAMLQKELEGKFAVERKLREQEVKSEKEILALKITSLTSDNTRQAAEIERLKKALEEAIRQLKEVALKVIEGRAGGVTGKQEALTE